MKKWLYILLLFTTAAKAQATYTLQIAPADSFERKQFKLVLKQLTHKSTFDTKQERAKEVSDFLIKLYDNGYLAASFDSLGADSLNRKAFLTLGNQYKWISLQKGNVDEVTLSEIGYREKLYATKPFYYKSLVRMMERILVFNENNGFPFASIALDSLQIHDGNMSGKLHVEKKAYTSIDSVIVKGNAKISPIYLYNYLSIKPGTPYNEALIRQISTRIRELPFLQEMRPFEIAFYQRDASLLLYLQSKKSSQFDFLVGILPDNANTGKTQITGEAHLKLQNSFARGEVFELNWKSPVPLTQDLKLKLIYPFLFNTQFGADIDFSLYKHDTTYVDVNRTLGLQYLLNGGSYFKAFYSNTSSTLLSVHGQENATSLPPHIDLEINTYGIGLRNERLDYRLNPRKGRSIDISGGVGTKQIKQNSKINEDAYKNIDLSTTQLNVSYTIDWYLPVGKRSTVNLGVKGAALKSPNVFQNELFRIGGLKTLRGFDEESILASVYNIWKVEYRYLTEQNAYLFAFVNAAYYEKKANDSFVHDTPIGFGSGITFETKLGIFAVSYALGKQFDNPIYFRNGKIHFGIISYF